jgi:uncharacterized OB-fold protein
MSVQIREYPGTALREEDVTSGRVLTASGSAQATYAWDLGIAIGRYLAELRTGRLVGRRCVSCQRVLFPPRAFCEECFRPTLEWVVLADTGVIQTFAICYITWNAERIAEPKVPAVIAIDGASPGMGLLHLIGSADPARVAIGQKVRAVWEPANLRRGAITDIAYFTPVEVE